MEQFWKILVFTCAGVSTILTTVSYLMDIKGGSYRSVVNTYIPAMCYDSTGNPIRDCLGGWFYKVSTKSAEKNASFAKSHNWNYVLLSSNVKSQSARERLVNNVLAFRKQNIAVHLMCLEDTVYIDHPTSAYDEISDILKFVNENNLDIQGIHTDCEPHGREDWKKANSEEKKRIFKDYLKVIEYGRKAINEFRPNTVYSGAVAWWYPQKVVSKELQYGRGYDLVKKTRFDFIIPMIYGGAGGTIERVVSRSDDYINDGVATVVGISVEDYEYSKFNDVIKEIKKIRNQKNNNEFFNGFSIYSNHHYPDWEKY